MPCVPEQYETRIQAISGAPTPHRQDDGLRFPRIQVRAKALHLAFPYCLPEMNEFGESRLRLQEFVPDCLWNIDFAVETPRNPDLTDLDERRNC